MTSITKNYKTSTALVTITVVAGFLFAKSLHVVLAAHDVNVQTEINQKEYCKTDRANSPISDLCTARFSNTIIQNGRSEVTDPESAATSTSTSTSTTPTTATHPTVLTVSTLNIAPNPVVRGQVVTVSGLLINTLSGSGMGGATIKFTGPLGRLASPDGSFSTSFTATTTGRSTIQAHYTGAGIYEPSESVKIALFVT